MVTLAEGYQLLRQGAQDVEKGFGTLAKGKAGRSVGSSIMREEAEGFKGGEGGRAQAAAMAVTGDIKGSAAMRAKKMTIDEHIGQLGIQLTKMDPNSPEYAAVQKNFMDLNKKNYILKTYAKGAAKEAGNRTVKPSDFSMKYFTYNKLYEGLENKPKQGFFETDKAYKARESKWIVESRMKIIKNVNSVYGNYPESSQEYAINSGFSKLDSPGLTNMSEWLGGKENIDDKFTRGNREEDLPITKTTYKKGQPIVSSGFYVNLLDPTLMPGNVSNPQKEIVATDEKKDIEAVQAQVEKYSSYLKEKGEKFTTDDLLETIVRDGHVTKNQTALYLNSLKTGNPQGTPSQKVPEKAKTVRDSLTFESPSAQLHKMKAKKNLSENKAKLDSLKKKKNEADKDLKTAAASKNAVGGVTRLKKAERKVASLDKKIAMFEKEVKLGG